MRIVFLLILVAGIGLAGYAAYMVMQQFEGYQTQIANLDNQLRVAKEGQIETQTVIVATEELRYGAELRKENVREIEWPVANIPENIYTSMDELFGPENAESRYVIRQMDLNEPVLVSKVTEFGEDAGLRSRLAPGMRAFAIRVDVASGVSGFLQPGDLIDIYWTGNGGGAGGGAETRQTITKLIMNGVKLIAIDQLSDEDILRPTVVNTVTVEISPVDVAKLVQAQASGRLTLALRGVEDTDLIEAIEVDQSDIIPNEIIVIEKERVCTRRERRGTEVIEIVIPCPAE